MVPEGYKKLDAWRTSKSLAAQWSVLLIIGLIAFTLIFSSIYTLFSGKNIDFSEAFSPSSLVLFLLSTVLVIILHEGAHGVAAMLVGGKPRYGFSLSSGIPVAYTTFDQIISRNRFIFVSWTPLVGLTIIGLVLMFVVPYASVPFLIYCMSASAAGSVGDTWLVKQALRYPKHVLIKDEKDELVVFGKDNDEPKNIPTNSFWSLLFKGFSIAFVILTVVDWVLLVVLPRNNPLIILGPNEFFAIYYFGEGVGAPIAPLFPGQLILCLFVGVVYAVFKSNRLPGFHSYD